MSKMIKQKLIEKLVEKLEYKLEKLAANIKKEIEEAQEFKNFLEFKANLKKRLVPESQESKAFYESIIRGQQKMLIYNWELYKLSTRFSFYSFFAVLLGTDKFEVDSLINYALDNNQEFCKSWYEQHYEKSKLVKKAKEIYNSLDYSSS